MKLNSTLTPINRVVVFTFDDDLTINSVDHKIPYKSNSEQVKYSLGGFELTFSLLSSFSTLNCTISSLNASIVFVLTSILGLVNHQISC